MDTLTPKNITALKNFAVIVKTRLTNAVDTNAVDTNAVDTNAVDTNAVDTNAVDTNAVDTNAVDTNAVDTNVVDTNADYHTCGKLVEMNGRTKRCTGWMGEHGCYYCDHTGFECHCGNPIDKDEDFCSGYCKWAYWNCR